MELVTTVLLSIPPVAHDTAVWSEAAADTAPIRLDAARRSAVDAAPSAHAHAPRFADILGQTLAGPLFATWSPTAAIVATNKSASTHLTVASLDNSGRRDGRKRSRR